MYSGIHNMKDLACIQNVKVHEIQFLKNICIRGVKSILIII